MYAQTVLRSSTGRTGIVPRSNSYSDFWPAYLADHSRRGTRAWHYAGAALAIAMVLVAVAVGPVWLILGSPVVGYACAWIGHATVERNRPATFRHPVWSFVSELRMCGLWLIGRLDRELERTGVTPRP